jgi:hypothetical protein
MAKTQIVWTLLPYGMTNDRGHRRVSVVVSPRLTPESAGEQTLAAFPEFLDWPGTIDGAKFFAERGGDKIPLELISKPDPDLWRELFTKETPVAGFVYKDMSRVNLRSYSVRNMLGFLKKHYGKLAVQSASNLPSLLPWNGAHPDLKNMLGEAGTRTTKINFGDRSVEVPLPGFDRFFDPGFDAILDRQVFSQDGKYHMGVPGIGAEDAGSPPVVANMVRRVMNPNWDASMTEFNSAEEYTLYQADRFYRRTRPSDAERKMRRPDYKDIAAAPKAPEYDFHRMLSALANYPELMRRLGLVLDFVFTDEVWLEKGIASGGGSMKSRLRLNMDWNNKHDPTTDVAPWTAFFADNERFVTRSRGKDQVRGLLSLAHSDDSHAETKEGLFDLYQVDPDGAALKTVDFTLTAQNLVKKHLSLRQKHGEVTYTTGDRQGVAALRSGGLGVSRHGRAVEVAVGAAAATLKNDAITGGSGGAMTLFAEDVHRGYRVDVALVPDTIKAGKWHTLCARVGDYRMIKSGKGLELKPDEGYVSGASTTSGGADSANPDDHYLHESLFRWTGWSLCAPRPGLAIKAEQASDSQIQAEVPSKIDDYAENGSGINATFKTRKGTLPRLRFGQLYRFRARIVDLAGNSLEVDDKTLGELEQASNAVGYWRFEPIDPPITVHRTRVSEGESLERMVIRSNYDASPEQYLETEVFTKAIALPDSADFAYGKVNERHFVPPKSSQLQCETHGMFEPYFSDWQTIKKGYEIAAREAGTLYDEPPGSAVELVTPKVLDGIATTTSGAPQLPNAENPVGDRMAGGQYVIHGEAQITTPWLPDAASGGTAIRAATGHTLPGVTAPKVLGPGCVITMTPSQQFVILVANGGDWPDSRGFRLILAERKAALDAPPCVEMFADAGEPIWNETERTLTLFVAKGRIVRLVYSSAANLKLLPSFGIPQWTALGAERNFVYASALIGANWLITPFRDLTLVHATQAPVCTPEFIDLLAHRESGSHDATLVTRKGVRLHGPSTGKFEVEAEWSEWVDDLSKPKPQRVQFKGQLGEIKLTENHSNQFTLKQAVDEQLIDPADPNQQRGDIHSLGDTRFRLIKYRLRATTRFREYLPPSIYVKAENVTRLGSEALGLNMLLPAEDDMGAPVLQDAAGTDQQTIVPSTAAPKDPRVLYVVPTFRWTPRAEDLPLASQPSPGVVNHDATRYGNGLRVWLDRPWFSSGDGELLGVVLYKEGGRFTDISADLQPLVTQWGVDPFWDSTLPKNQTKETDFPARVHTEQLQLQEKSAQTDPYVLIVGHRVHWDDARSLWYCDIELDPGLTYTPFVRLALVRYQPNALFNAKISKVVLTDFAQVLPRRRATVNVNANHITATLHGPNPNYGPIKFSLDGAYQGVPAAPTTDPEEGRNRVELVLQTRDPAIDSDLAWEDTAILASHVVGKEPPAPPPPPVAAPAPQVSAQKAAAQPSPAVRPQVREMLKSSASFSMLSAVKVETRASGTVRLESTVDLTKVITTLPDINQDLPVFIDPAFWDATANLPASTGNKPRRLMLREFERFYSDHVVSEPATVPRYHRIIEERLVFADIIPL